MKEATKDRSCRMDGRIEQTQRREREDRRRVSSWRKGMGIDQD